MTDVDPNSWAIERSLVTAAECRILAGGYQPGSGRLRRRARAPFVDRVERAARLVSGSIDHVRTAVLRARGVSDVNSDVVNSYIYPSYVSVWIAVSGPARISIAGSEPTASPTAGPHALDQVAAAAELAPGDAWIAKNDVPHRVDGELMIEFRAICSTATITRQQLMDMGAIKFDRMARMRIVFARRFATFQVAQRDTLSLREYDAIYDELKAREQAARERLGVAQLSNNRFEDVVHELAVDYAQRRDPA